MRYCTQCKREEAWMSQKKKTTKTCLRNAAHEVRECPIHGAYCHDCNLPINDQPDCPMCENWEEK